MRGEEAEDELETRVVLDQLDHVHEDELLEAADHVLVLHDNNNKYICIAP